MLLAVYFFKGPLTRNCQMTVDQVGACDRRDVRDLNDAGHATLTSSAGHLPVSLAAKRELTDNLNNS